MTCFMFQHFNVSTSADDSIFENNKDLIMFIIKVACIFTWFHYYQIFRALVKVRWRPNWNISCLITNLQEDPDVLSSCCFSLLFSFLQLWKHEILLESGLYRIINHLYKVDVKLIQTEVQTWPSSLFQPMNPACRLLPAPHSHSWPVSCFTQKDPSLKKLQKQNWSKLYFNDFMVLHTESSNNSVWRL